MRALFTLLGLLFLIVPLSTNALATNVDPYHGIYKGWCEPPTGSSKPLMVFVAPKKNNRNQAYMLSESFTTEFEVQSGGIFSAFDDITGTFTRQSFSGITGSTDPSLCVAINGNKLRKEGFAFPVAGYYYAGEVEGKMLRRADNIVIGDIFTGRVAVIIASNGEAFAQVSAIGNHSWGLATGWEAGPASLSGTKLSAHDFLKGKIDFDSATGTGSFYNLFDTVCTWLPFFGVVCEDIEFRGTWTMTRQGAQINRTPELSDDSYFTFPGRELIVESEEGLFANDVDLDADPLTALLGDAPAHGTLNLSADGGFVYVPDKGFKGVDSFTYRAHDGLVESATATVQIEVSGVRIVPVIQLLLMSE